ncbi:MAG: hypothetical protein WCG75_07255 [Armatimonadota bacterium]
MNLQKSRILFALTVFGFLVLCNLAFLFATSQDRQTTFAQQIDQPSFQILSFLFLVGIIAFALIKPNDQEAQP